MAGWLIAGLAVLGVAIWWSFAGMRSPVPAPPMLAPPMLAPPVLAPPVAAVVPPSVPVAPTPQALKAPQAPSFDIVRVNPQGGAVVAGRAAPDNPASLSPGAVAKGEAQPGSWR